MDLANPYAVLPVAEADAPERVAYLRKVAALVVAALGITAAVSVVTLVLVTLLPALHSTPIMLCATLGGMYGSQFLGRSTLSSPSQGVRIGGFVAGSALQGVAVGYLLLVAALASVDVFGNPLIFIGQAGALIILTVLGMVAYLTSGPRELSLVSSALATLTLPMLGLMVLGLVFPVGGVVGILISLAFVVVSAAGLLYNLNQVIRRMSTDMVLAGAFHIATGIVVLFWNLLSLLMSLRQRR